MATQALESVETTPGEFPSSMAVAIRTAPMMELASPAEIQRAMQQLDAQAFLADIMGEALEKWFYSFKIAGKSIEGVSAKGAHEFARLRAEQGFPIRFPIDQVRYEETTENGELGIRAMVVARDHRSGMEGIGLGFYPHYEERSIKENGTVIRVERVFDRMAGRKAMSVAERNAILRLIPENVILSSLKVRAQIVAENEKSRQAQERLAYAERPEAPRITAGTQTAEDPYNQGTQPARPAAAAPKAAQQDQSDQRCPECGGEMWDNRQSKRSPNSPDFKCKNAPKQRGQAGCEGVIWPPREA